MSLNPAEPRANYLPERAEIPVIIMNSADITVSVSMHRQQLLEYEVKTCYNFPMNKNMLNIWQIFAKNEE